VTDNPSHLGNYVTADTQKSCISLPGPGKRLRRLNVLRTCRHPLTWEVAAAVYCPHHDRRPMQASSRRAGRWHLRAAACRPGPARCPSALVLGVAFRAAALPGFLLIHMGIRVVQKLLDVVGGTPRRAHRGAQRDRCRTGVVAPRECSAEAVRQLSNMLPGLGCGGQHHERIASSRVRSASACSVISVT